MILCVSSAVLTGDYELQPEHILRTKPRPHSPPPKQRFLQIKVLPGLLTLLTLQEQIIHAAFITVRVSTSCDGEGRTSGCPARAQDLGGNELHYT